jgi:orotidine-5'-phosphate decarboxylase
LKFYEKLDNIIENNQSLLCIGLDPIKENMPIDDIFKFNQLIVDYTADLVCAYKPNFAFYEAAGIEGLRALEKTISHIKSTNNDIVIIGDAKRGDIGHTAQAYADALFKFWDFDAITINPFAGFDSVQPFLSYSDRGVFAWVKSSNPDGKTFQDLIVNSLELNTSEKPELLYEHMIKEIIQWNHHDNLGIVVGATYPIELGVARKLAPYCPLLIPGVGSQSGALKESLQMSVNQLTKRSIINSSRGILYASSESNFPEIARNKAEYLRLEIQQIIKTLI